MASPDTQTAVLDAARELFAEKGYPATSLREITRKAGVNLAAVNYHFGSKEGLLKALVRECLDPINEKRLQRLDQAEAEAPGQGVELERLIRIFLEPVFESVACDDSSPVPCLLARMHHEPHPQLHQMLPEILAPVIQRFMTALQRCLPDHSLEVLSIRSQFMVGAMLHVLDLHETIDGVRLDNREEMLQDLVRYSAAGYRAPRAS